MQLFIFLTAVFAVKAYGAVVPEKLDSEVCLCLGTTHCFMINGVIEDESLVTPLARDVYIHLPLSTFTVESPDTCASRRKRGTDISVHGSDKGGGISVDHQSGNTHVHGSVDADTHGHVSGSGSISHQSGNTNTHGSLSVDSHGHVSGSAGVDHQSGNVHTNAGVSVDEHGHVSGSFGVDHQSGNVHTNAGVSVDEHGHVSAHVGVGISFGRK